MLLAHDDVGAGPVVVLIHSGVADRRMWAAQSTALSKNRRVVAVDLRGFGETPLPEEAYSSADDIVDLLTDLQVRRAAVVGSSMGGQVALELVAAYPHLVTSLALLCTAFHGLELTQAVKQFGEREDALLEAGDIDGAVELNVATWVGPDASDDARALVRAMQRHAFDVQLGSEDAEREVPADPAAIRCPTLVVSGALDLDHFQNIAAHLAATIPGARSTVLPWAAHLPSLERPDEINALLTEFLDGAEPAGSRADAPGSLAD